MKGSVGDLISEAMEDFDADDTDQQSSEHTMMCTLRAHVLSLFIVCLFTFSCRDSV